MIFICFWSVYITLSSSHIILAKYAHVLEFCQNIKFFLWLLADLVVGGSNESAPSRKIDSDMDQMGGMFPPFSLYKILHYLILFYADM